MTRRGMAVGAATILTVFAVLCITVFAALTLLSARSELALAEKSSAAVADYYAAELNAERRLAEQSAAEGETITVSEQIDQARTLLVQAVSEGGQLRVLSRRAVRTADWAPDDTVNLK